MRRPRCWRPRRFAEIIGAENAKHVCRLQQAARKRSPVTALLVGPYGAAKTSLARLLMQSYCCDRPNPETADPCLRCDGCSRQGPPYNGEFHRLRHWEIDCTRDISRKEVSILLREAELDGQAALFLDELSRLSESAAQSPLLKYTEDMDDGLFLAACPDYQLKNILPPLYERLRKVYLSIPTAQEMVTFLWHLLPEWGINAEQATLQDLVARSQRSFRTCFTVLDHVFDDEGKTLDRQLLDEVLGETDSGSAAGTTVQL